MAGHMNLYESVCHAFGTIATGGFSPKNSSIGGYSPYIQYVIMIFMFLSGTNYIIYYYLIKLNFFKIKRNDEFKFYFIVTFLIGAVVTAILVFQMRKPLELAFREAYFQVISIITCTGFATADYLKWPTVAWVIIFFSMFLGGSTGSTAGGIKMVRHLIFYKALRKNFKKIMHPHAVFSIHLNGRSLAKSFINSNLSFIVLYILVFLVGTFVLITMGLDGATASSSVATCMAGIGPGIGSVGPASNFAHLPDAAKVLLPFIMVLGRLEIYPILVLFTKSFWKA
jgi:trk system potassium uptake protein TrkH